MKTSIPLLTILSASLVAAVPFTDDGPLVAARAIDLANPNTNFGRRDEGVVQKFDKEALKLRGVLLATRGIMSEDNANANVGAANAEGAAGGANDKAQDQAAQDAAQAQQDAAAADGAKQEQGEADKQKGAAEQAAADQKVCAIFSVV